MKRALLPDVDWNEENRYEYFLVDVFTRTPLEGNQLAVFTDARELSGARMQDLAREMGFSETVFLLPAESGGDLRMCIFTPTNELPFAGHPVLGTAILAGRALGLETVTLETGAGNVPVRLDGPVSGQMEQPVPSWRPYEHRDELLGALGLKDSVSPVETYDNGPMHVYVELPDELALATLDPDLKALARLPGIGAYCFAGSGTRWKSRMFAPSEGIAEDAATGSAAGPLAVHLARHGRIPFGEQIEIRQGEEIGRPSVLYARVQGNPSRIDKVEVAGSAIVVGRGEMFLPGAA